MAETASEPTSNSGAGSSVKKMKQKFSSFSKTKKALVILGIILVICLLIAGCAGLIIFLKREKNPSSNLLSDIGTKSSAANTDSQLSPSRSPAGVKVANVSFLSNSSGKKENNLAKKRKSSSKSGSSGLKVDSSLKIQNMLGVKDVRLVNGKSTNLVESDIQ